MRYCTYVARAFLGNGPEPDAIYAGRYTARRRHVPEVAENGLLAGRMVNYRGSGTRWNRWLKKHPDARVEICIVTRHETEVAMLAVEPRLIRLAKSYSGSRCKNLTTSARGFTRASARKAGLAATALKDVDGKSVHGRKGAAALNAKLTSTQRSANGRKGAAATNAKLTPEQRRINTRKGAAALNAKLTPAQRSANARKGGRPRGALLKFIHERSIGTRKNIPELLKATRRRNHRTRPWQTM